VSFLGKRKEKVRRTKFKRERNEGAVKTTDTVENCAPFIITCCTMQTERDKQIQNMMGHKQTRHERGLAGLVKLCIASPHDLVLALSPDGQAMQERSIECNEKRARRTR
jgi:hypothetical protein